MEFTKIGVIERKIEAIAAAIIAHSAPLTQWETREGFYAAPGKYEIQEPAYVPIRIGDRWTCRDGTTRWFVREVVIPAAFAGYAVALEIELGGEGLVRVDGEIRSAITSYLRRQPATRTRVWLTDCAQGGERFEVDVEAGMNYMEFDAFRSQGQTSIEYELTRAEIVAIDRDCEAYYFDVRTAFDAALVLQNPLDGLLHSNVLLPGSAERLLERMGKDPFIYERVVHAVQRSLALVDVDFDRERLISTLPAARELLRSELESIPHSPHALIRFVGQAHIDTAWLWPIKETVRKCAKTLSNVLDLMDRYSDFTFAFSQPQLYAFVKEHYPELYSRVCEKVASGNFELVGNTWVEMDTNVPSGESLVRQILYGRNFFLREFGKSSRVFWMPDVFGYSWALPQIIKRSGMEFFFTSKLVNNDTNRFPHSLFQWQGVDGTRVLAYLQKLNYNGTLGPECIDTLYQKFDQKAISDELMMTFGYGDGGGGPSYQMLEAQKRLHSFPGLQRAEMRTSESFFEAVAPLMDELPIWNDEMYYEFHRGTYTSQASVKRNNRRAEMCLREAEMFAVLASRALAREYPYEDLFEAYRIVLTNQFHDIIPGSSIHQVYVDAAREYARALSLTTSVLQGARDALFAAMPHENDAVVVFNPLGHARGGRVRVRLNGAHAQMPELTVLNEAGSEVPARREDNGDLSFLCASVPPLGYAMYTLAVRAPSGFVPVTATERTLENEFLLVEISPNGELSRVLDKRTHHDVLSDASNRLEVFEDRPAAETAWNIDLEYQNKVWALLDVESIQVIESSALRGAVRVARRFHNSTIVQDIVLPAGEAVVYFETRVEWQETEKMLKAAFHINVLSPRATYEIQFGAIERPTHWNTSYDKARFEVCGHKWADLSEGAYGVALLNESKYGYDIKENRMRLTLLRAPINPDPTADKGEHFFTYALAPHEGDFRAGGVVRTGYELNAPLTGVHPGDSVKAGVLPARFSLAQADAPHVVIDTVKQAEDGDGMILRLYEAHGARGRVNVSLGVPVCAVTECNLMEENESELELSGRSFSFFIKPYQVRTFRVQGRGFDLCVADDRSCPRRGE